MTGPSARGSADSDGEAHDELVVVALRYAAVLLWYGPLGSEEVELRVEEEDVGHLDAEHGFPDVVGVAARREEERGVSLTSSLVLQTSNRSQYPSSVSRTRASLKPKSAMS